jgi:hypothetical protein
MPVLNEPADITAFANSLVVSVNSAHGKLDPTTIASTLLGTTVRFVAEADKVSRADAMLIIISFLKPHATVPN